MDDSADKPPARGDQEYAAHLGKHIRRALLGLALMALPSVLTWAGLLTGPGWAWPVWVCEGLGLGLALVVAFRVAVGPVGPGLRTTPARQAPRVPASPEVQAHQRRMSGDQDSA